MTTIEIILIGVALSMDAAALAMTNGMVYRNYDPGNDMVPCPLFCLAQARCLHRFFRRYARRATP